ncbi:hypothetical protein HK101_001553 [Irineochytrium annulatum]|nr:hypothetical protein HK101_001553 [Irineochytrium annulatum]
MRSSSSSSSASSSVLDALIGAKSSNDNRPATTAGARPLDPPASELEPAKPAPPPLTPSRQPHPTATPSILSSLFSTPFSLPAIFAPSSSSLIRKDILHYPWLLSTDPPRKKPQTLLAVLHEKSVLKPAAERARKAMLGAAYDMPDHFCEDAAIVVKTLLEAMSDPERAGDPDALRPLMVRSLAEEYATGYRELAAKGKRTEIVLSSKPKVRVTGYHFTYGPYPMPEGYEAQNWMSFMTLVVPRESAAFTGYAEQKRVMKEAEKAGVYFKINCTVNARIEMIVRDENDIPLLRDRRDQIDMQFISPHFDPWDEIFELQPDGLWKLRWTWRVSDIDYLIEGRAAPLQTPSIAWTDRTFGKVDKIEGRGGHFGEDPRVTATTPEGAAWIKGGGGNPMLESGGKAVVAGGEKPGGVIVDQKGAVEAKRTLGTVWSLGGDPIVRKPASEVEKSAAEAGEERSGEKVGDSDKEPKH